MRRAHLKGRFKKDLKRLSKRGWNLDKSDTTAKGGGLMSRVASKAIDRPPVMAAPVDGLPYLVVKED